MSPTFKSDWSENYLAFSNFIFLTLSLGEILPSPRSGQLEPSCFLEHHISDCCAWLLSFLWETFHPPLKAVGQAILIAQTSSTL